MRTKAWLLCVLCGCDPGPRAIAPAVAVIPSEPATSVVEPALPSDTEAILRELAPVPMGTVVIVYDIEGPAGIRGTLEVLAAAGGRRRDNWQVTLPLTEGVREIHGSRVRTPELRWHADGDDVGRMQPSTLGATAAAIAALAPEARARVLAELRRWRAELARARADKPGERERIAGIECTRVHAGAGLVCIWDELGLPLRYEGPAFRVVARHVELGATLGPRAYEIPADAVVEAPAGADGPRLAAILAGEHAEILRLLRPELDPLPGLLPAG